MTAAQIAGTNGTALLLRGSGFALLRLAFCRFVLRRFAWTIRLTAPPKGGAGKNCPASKILLSNAVTERARTAQRLRLP